MKITVDISPEEVVSLLKGNVELTTAITTAVTKAITEVVVTESKKSPFGWWTGEWK